MGRTMHEQATLNHLTTRRGKGCAHHARDLRCSARAAHRAPDRPRRGGLFLALLKKRDKRSINEVHISS